MRLRVLFIIFALVFLPAGVGAEKIYLKNGQVFQGKVTKDTGYSIQIMQQGGFPKTFFMDEVDRIEPDQTGPEGTAGGANGNEDVTEAITDEKRNLIFRLMEANGARQSMSQIFNQIIAQAPAEAQGKYRGLFKVDEVISRLVPIYAKYYTTEDLKALITFYKSPLGQKHIGVTPFVLEESMKETVKYFQEKMPQEDKKSTAK